MEFVYKMSGTCATRVAFDLAPDGTVTKIRFAGGCDGNLKAISKILDGWKAPDIIRCLKGNTCGPRPTSCADQLSLMLVKAQRELEKGAVVK